MNYRLNSRLLVRVIGTTFLVLVCVHLLHAFQVNRQADTLLEQAQQAKAEKDYARSTLFLDHYLQREPDDLHAKAEYGLVLALSARSAPQEWRALHVLEEVVQQLPEHREARERLAHLAVKLREYQKATNILKPLRSRLKGKDLGELEHTLGWCYLAANEIEEAMRAFQSAVYHAPKYLPGYVDLARLSRREGDQKQAEETIQAMVQFNPRDAEAYVERARYRRKGKQWEPAARDYQTAIQLAPESIDVYLEAAELARFRGHIETARELLQKGIKKKPEHAHLYLVAAYLERDVKQSDQALHWIQSGLKRRPDSAPLLTLLAQTLSEKGEFKELVSIQAKLDQLNVGSHWGEYVQALREMEGNKWVEAARRFERLRKAFQGAPIHLHNLELSLAECYRHCADLSLEIKACSRALNADSVSHLALIVRNNALLQDGQLRYAYDGWQQMQKNGTKAFAGQSWIGIARVLLRWYQTQTTNPDWTQLERVVKQATLAKADPAKVLMLEVEMRLAREQFTKAKQLLSQGITKHRDDIALWIALVDLNARQGDWYLAQQLMSQAQRHFGDRAELRLAQLNLVLQYQTIDRTTISRLEVLLEDIDKFTPEEQGKLWQAMASAHARAGAYGDAIRTCQQWLNLQPYSMAASVALFDLANHRWSEKHLDLAIDQMKYIEGSKGIRWRCAAALRWIGRLQRTGDRTAATKAQEQLREVAKLNPNHTRGLLLQAKLDELEGELDQAIESYLTVFRRGDYHAATVEHLISLLMEKKRFLEAEQIYKTYSTHAQVSRSLARLGAELSLEIRDSQSAVNRARRAINPKSTDYRDFLWQIEIYHQLGRYIEAEQLINESLERFKKVPALWQAKIQHYLLTNKREQAESLLTQMTPHLRERDRTVALAQCYELLGLQKEAEQAYLLAYQKQSMDPILIQRLAQFYVGLEEYEKAVKYLKPLAHPRSLAPKQQIHWARRQLALIEARYHAMVSNEQNPSLSQHQRVHKALQWLKLNWKKGQESVHERRYRAFVLATLPERRSEALTMLEDSFSETALTAEERFRLAHLYNTYGERAQADQQFRALLSAEPRNARYLAGYIRQLIDEGAKREARHWLYRLQQLEPESARTRRLQSMIR